MALSRAKVMVVSGATAMLGANVLFLGWAFTQSASVAGWGFLLMLLSLVIPLATLWIPAGIRHAIRRARGRRGGAEPGADAG